MQATLEIPDALLAKAQAEADALTAGDLAAWVVWAIRRELGVEDEWENRGGAQ